jgi:hypothetical protein
VKSSSFKLLLWKIALEAIDIYVGGVHLFVGASWIDVIGATASGIYITTLPT